MGEVCEAAYLILSRHIKAFSSCFLLHFCADEI